ncbi:transglycosylase SLT domain-containing protein [candidate division KSB1 bacterium]|nr:transglycosylase SLT domain-containing protein [candidate division KSB1 bacterium]
MKAIIQRRIVRLLAFILVLTVLIPALVLHNKLTAQSIKLNNIAKSVQEQEFLAMLEIEQQTSIQKIEDIISRYNKDMVNQQKRVIANEIYLMSKKYPNLNIDFICATITHESAKTWKPTVTSTVGAMGLMQVMPATGAFLAAEEGVLWTSAEEVLYDPITNIRLGCRYLSELVTMYEQDGGLAAYNGGPKRAEMWLASNRNNNILWAETRDYVPAVLKLYEEFRSETVM